MLEYNRIDISEVIVVNRSSNSRECSICHYWYFLDRNFSYQKYLFNGCHDLMEKTISLILLLLYLLKAMIKEFIFGIGAKMMQ